LTILLLTQKDIFHFKKREFYNPSSCPIGIGEKGRNEMKHPRPIVEMYALKNSKGKHIRMATKVIFPNGEEVAFTESMKIADAIKQAEEIRKKKKGHNPKETYLGELYINGEWEETPDY